MKKSLLVASLLLTSSSVMASDYFVGVNLLKSNSSANVSGTMNIGGTTYNVVENTPSDNNLNFKFGMIDNSNRYTISTGTKLKDKGTEYSSTEISYDYLFEKTDIYTPYAGVSLGRGKLKDEIFGNHNVAEYGVQTGVIIDIKNNFEFEAGVSYTKLSGDTTATNGSGTYQGNAFTNLNGSLDTKSATGLYIGINYKF